MVRPRTRPSAVNVHITKKAGTRGNASPISGSSSTQKLQKSQQQSASCRGCGATVLDDTKALQCDKCAESWKCVACLHLTGDVYDQLVSDTSIPLKWFCDNCEQDTTRNQQPSSEQSEKLDKLITVIEKLMSRYDSLEQKLQSKCDASVTVQLDKRITWLEEKIQKYETDLEARLVPMEEYIRFNAATLSVDKEKEKENVIPDEDLIKFVVQEELNRKTEEDRDAENRKKNIIIYRIPEKKTDNVSERKASDTNFVKDMLDGVFNVNLEENDIEKMFRLGRWNEDKARPLLVAFKSCEMKDHIMANAKKLRQSVAKFQGISVANDLHPKERNEIKQLVDNAKLEHLSNAEEGDDVENYKFLVVGHGAKRRAIKIKRRNNIG